MFIAAVLIIAMVETTEMSIDGWMDEQNVAYMQQNIIQT